MKSMTLNSGWLAARANEVSWAGEQLTTSHVPSLKINPWMEAAVPGTILTTLLKNKLIPDPFYGMENQNVADIADVGRDHYTFWFYNNFDTPSDLNFKRAWLQFRAINYSADVFINGTKYSLPGGMFFRHKLDITTSLKGHGERNHMVVLVHPPDHPGKIPPEGGQGGDHDIAKDVAAQYVEGWDWIIPIRDRNTGIWDDVTVSFTGWATIGDPHLVATFYDDFKRSYLNVYSEVTNTSSAPLKCTAKVQVTLDDADENYCVVENVESQNLEIPSDSTILCTFKPLFFYKPQLWWPNGMGKQPLYDVVVSLTVDDKDESDSWSHPFGFRKIDSFINPETNSRQFQVNGEPLFIRGGNWIVSDGLLRLTKERYDTNIDFHADMNLNMIRVWGGALAERPLFYEACDRRGILVWQEFWITGDCNGRGVSPSDSSWPLDHALFLKCANDTVKLLRNHPSLALWVGGNEQHPPDDINQALTDMLRMFNSSDEDLSKYLDGTRLYIQGSLWEGIAAGDGNFRDGPYTIQNPEDYYSDSFYIYGFNPEVGSVGIPLAATIKATMPESAWKIPKIEAVKNGLVKEIPNPTWVLHTYIPYAEPDHNVPHQIAKYGDPTNIDDFCDKLVNYVQYRALLEAWNSRMWTKFTGVLIWKIQNPWSGLRGQLYDYFLDQTGGFFGARSACEPVHVQLNLATHSIEVVNTTKISYTDTTLEASVWNLDGKCSHKTGMKNLSVPPYKTLAVISLGYEDKDDVYFVLLKLIDMSGKLISRNFYWLHREGGDYKLLNTEFMKKVPVKLTLKSSLANGAFKINAHVENVSETKYVGEEQEVVSGMRKYFSMFASSEKKSNTRQSSPGVAFWLRFSVHSGKKIINNEIDTRLLPVTYSDNYFSLVPGEALDIEMSFRIDEKDTAKVVLQGWNIASIDKCLLR